MFIDCQALAESEIERLKTVVSKLEEKPILYIVQIGNDYASNVYIRNKLKVAERIGIDARHMTFSEDIHFDELLWEIADMEYGVESGAVMVQLPVPKRLEGIEHYVSPSRDVDGLHLENLGKLFIGDKSGHVPCTAKGIMKILEPYELEGKRAVVVGRSNIVGKPIAHLLLDRDCTVTVCHSKTKGLQNITREADIVICAMGNPNFFTKEYFKEGAIVVDVGINRNPETGKICGDVNPEVAEIANLTPVPKGVGLLTVVSLMENVIQSRK